MNIYLRKVASEGINHHVEHCIFVPAVLPFVSPSSQVFKGEFLVTDLGWWCGAPSPQSVLNGSPSIGCSKSLQEERRLMGSCKRSQCGDRSDRLGRLGC